jgi:hypothetical protein
VNFGFFPDQDATRFAYLRLRRLKAALADAKVLEALVAELELPNDAVALSRGRKQAAIDAQIERLRDTRTSLWYGVPAPEVLAALIFRAKKLAGGVVEELFNHAAREESVTAAIITWITGGGLTPVRGIPFGNDHVDLGGYRQGFLSGARVIAIQLRNDVAGVDRALEVLPALAAFTNATYLACTPATAASYLDAHASAQNPARWDGDLLRRKLVAAGSGLLMVEGSAVSQPLLPKERHLDDAVVAALKTTLEAAGGGRG